MSLDDIDIAMSHIITIYYDHTDDQWVCDIGEVDHYLAEGVVAACLRALKESGPEIQIRWAGGRWPEEEDEEADSDS